MLDKARFFVLVMAVAGLSACADGYMSPDNPQIVAQPDKASMMLAEAADRASVSLETLAAVEQHRSPGVAVAPIDDAPDEMNRAVTLSWAGPVEPVAKTLADRVGYRFRTIGTPPPVALVVQVDVENTPVIDVLRSIGLQLGVRADVRADGERKMIEIHYAPNSGIGG
jgi:defect-in-organelle-trafficking protein DotD